MCIDMCVPTYIHLEGVKMLVGKENISSNEELTISRRFPKLQRVLQILISEFECFIPTISAKHITKVSERKIQSLCSIWEALTFTDDCSIALTSFN